MSSMLFEEVKELWYDKFANWSDTDKFNLYIDNPFCISKCDFCVHFGCKTAIGSDVFKRYYEEYLPRQIKDFEAIISLKKPDSVYFGGGTASMMTAQIMDNIISMLPWIDTIREKSFECHPGLVTEEKLEVLLKHRFTYLSFGIQTFNERINKAQNRVPVQREKLKWIISKAQAKSLHVNCDLLAFIDNGDANDIDILTEDLRILTEDLLPDIITIYPMYQRFSFDLISKSLIGTKEENNASIELITKLYRTLIKLFNRADSEYKIPFGLSINTKNSDNFLNDIYISRLDKDAFITTAKDYSCSSFPYNPAHQNVIGLGGYGVRSPYSYQGNKIYYHTINENWQPKYVKLETKMQYTGGIIE